MESDALPYVLFLLLIELAFGASLVMTAVDLRGQVTQGFVRTTTIMLPILYGLALWLALSLEGEAVEGYRLDTGPRAAVPVLVGIMTALSVAQNGCWFSERVRMGRAAGIALALVGVAAVIVLAIMLRLPAWSGALVFVSLLVGSLALGLATVGLCLGHWYLVTPRLPARPLNEVTLAFLLLIAVQGAVVAWAMLAPVQETPVGGRDVALLDNPAFWLRVGVGLVFPAIVGGMAWSSSRMRSMMSATGLLYLVTGAVLAGEILARALLFDSGRAI